MYCDKDFGIGKEVIVLGRKFLMFFHFFFFFLTSPSNNSYDMDMFTRNYYAQTYGITDWPKVNVDLGQEKQVAPQGPRVFYFSSYYLFFHLSFTLSLFH